MGTVRAGHGHQHTVAAMRMSLLTESHPVPIDVELHYSARDPYAVRAVFRRPGHAAVVWTFARALVLAGLTRSAGLGDVRVRPQGGNVEFTLSSPEGSATLLAVGGDVRRFADQMLDLVAVGDEPSFMNIDTEIALLQAAVSAGDDA